MTDRRWQLINPEREVSGARYADAGTTAVNGDYYEDVALYEGRRVWTLVGGTFLEDSIHYEPTLGKYIMTSGGLYSDDTTNAKYDTPEDTNTTGILSTTWYARTGASTPPGGGTLPAPGTLTTTVDISYVEPATVIRDFGCLQPAKFSEEEDLIVGLIAKRRKLTSDIVFSGSDFGYFLAIERQASRRCEELIIRRQWRCNGVWKTIWTGVFSTGSGEWDFDKCEFTVRPEVLDEYTCIMRVLNKKVNVLDVAPVEVNALIWPSTIEILVSTGGVGFYDEYVLADTQSLTIPELGGPCVAPSYPYTDTYNIWWRERIVDYPCPDGVLDGGPGAWTNAPPGTGWVPEGYVGAWPISVPTLMKTWVREPTIAWPFANDPIVVGDLTPPGVGTPYPPSSPACNQWMLVQIASCIGDTSSVGLFICLDDPIEYVTITRGRTLESIANYLLTQSGCDQAEMVSDFLEWNPPGDTPGYSTGVNYVTGGTNQYNQIVAIQNSDAIDPSATNPAIKGEMTLKELLYMLATTMKLFWAIDDQGRVRIEHWSYWTNPVGLSVASFPDDEKSEPLSYKHLRSEIPRLERPKWSQAQGADFIGADIEYSGPCVSTDEENDLKEYNVGQFMTDLAFIVGTPEAINKEGFTLVATIFDGTVYDALIDYGALTGSLITNAPLSWANLERDFWQHDRFLPTGTMNREATEFLGFVPNIEQKNVFLKYCCEFADFDSTERVQTRLGIKLGNITAFVRRAEFDEATDGMDLTLRYAY